MKKLALSLFLFAAVAVFGGGAFSQAEAAKTDKIIFAAGRPDDACFAQIGRAHV